MKKTFRRFILTFIILTIFSCDKNKMFKKENIGNDYSIVDGISKIDELVRAEMNINNIPGLVILIKKNNKIIHHKSYGYSNVNKKIKFKNNDIFRIASLTKIITSIAALQLVEDGKISLSDPVEDFIPEFKNLTVIESFNPSDSSYTSRPAKNKITLKNLLTHTSGLTYGVSDNIPIFSEIYSKAGIVELFSKDNILQSKNIKKLASLPLLFEPGESFCYGMSTDVVGHLIEIISGKSLSDYLKTYLFDPLDMKDTFFYITGSKKKRLVPIQTNIDGFWKTYEGENYSIDFPLKGKEFFSGGAGLSSTAASFSKFLQMINNGGIYNNKRIISSKVIKSLKDNQIGHLVDDFSYGLASGVISEGLPGHPVNMTGIQGNIGSIFWYGFFGTYFLTDPSENLIYIIYKQLEDVEHNSSFEYDLRKIIYESISNIN